MIPERLREELWASLETTCRGFAVRVCFGRPGIEWHVESRPTRFYEWIVVLWFARVSAPLDELVAITATLDRADGRLRLDASGGESMDLYELEVELQVDGSGSLAGVDELVRDYLDSILPLTIAELTTRS